MLCQFIVLWVPMFLSSLTLSISNPGFTFGCEPNNDMQCIASVCLTLMDLSVFYLHPIILRWRISVLTKEQEGIEKSRNLALSQKYEKNAEILDLLNEQFFAFKKMELNLGGLHLLSGLDISIEKLYYSKPQSWNETTFPNFQINFFYHHFSYKITWQVDYIHTYILEWPRLWRITDLSLVVNK